MKILFADAFPAERLAEVETVHEGCVHRPDLTSEELPEALPGVDVLVVRSTPVTAEALTTADRLRLVIRAGAGTNTIDTEAAARHQVAVSNVPGRNAAAVAELAFALLLCLDRNVPDAVADLRAGRWDKARYARARGLYGRSVGVVGLGQIGLAFAERAHAFGMHVHAVAKADRPPETVARADAIGVAYVPDLPGLAEACDVLSFHVPATPTTYRLVDGELLAHCRDGAWLINTSRGDIVDEQALIEAMDQRGLRAGLDVFEDEPAERTGSLHSPLAQHPNVYGTHHIGASTEQAQLAVADEVVRMLAAFVEGRILHCVNGVDGARQPARVAAAEVAARGRTGQRHGRAPQ